MSSDGRPAHSGFFGLAAAVGLVSIAATALLAVSHDARAVVLDSGAVTIGFNADGTLVSTGAAPSATDATTKLGVRLDSSNAEGVGGLCGCEGWGVAHDGLSAYAKTGSPPLGISPVSFTPTATVATSVVDAAGLRITHTAHPSVAANAYAIDVTVANPGTVPVANVLYRRVVDWATEPTAGHEAVSLHAATPAPSLLAFSSDNGAASADPLAGPSLILAAGPPTAGELTDSGPADHGAVFDLALGCLGPGDSAQFTLFYGATSSESGALATLSSIGAQAWSLGQPNVDPAAGTPQTFFLAFSGIDGPACLDPLFTSVFATTSPQDLTLDPVAFVDVSLPAGLAGLEVQRSWTFGDASASLEPSPAHTYLAAGTYDACLHLAAHVPGSAAPWRTWSACHALAVHDRPPVASFSSMNLTAPGTVLFSDASSDEDGNITARAWAFGDGATSGLASPEHGYVLEGTYDVCLQVTDNDGAASQSCHLIAAPAQINRPPLLMPVRSRHVAVGALVQFTLLAFDPEGDAVAFSAKDLPPGSSFVAATGAFSWMPGNLDVGLHDKTVFRATDTHGAYSERHFAILIGSISLDADRDGVADEADVCPGIYNPDQADGDADGVGDLCDDETIPLATLKSILVGPSPADAAGGSGDGCDAERNDADGDGLWDACDEDMDGDGVPNRGPAGALLDNCPLQPNADQADSDGDGWGDACAPPAALAIGPDGATGGASHAKPAARAPAETGPSQAWILLPFAALGLLAGLVAALLIRRR